MNRDTNSLAWVRRGDHTLKLEARPRPEVRRGEVLAEVLHVAVCGTDLQILAGDREDRASVLGHEGVVRVVETGPGVTRVAVGDTAVINPVNPRDQDDIVGHSSDGLFQTMIRFTSAAVAHDVLVPLKPGLPEVLGVLAEPLGAVVYGHSLVERICQARTIVVIGAGPIGLLHALLAREQGRKVLLVSRSDARRRWAVRQGIVDETSTVLHRDDPVRFVYEKSDGRGADVAYLCTDRSGAQDALRCALAYVRPEGCIDLVGGIGDLSRCADLPDVHLNAVRRANHCGEPREGVIDRVRTRDGKMLHLSGHRGTSVAHLVTAMDWLGRWPERFWSVVSHVIPFKALGSTVTTGFREQRQIDGAPCCKVVVSMSSVCRQGVA